MVASESWLWGEVSKLSLIRSSVTTGRARRRIKRVVKRVCHFFYTRHSMPPPTRKNSGLLFYRAAASETWRRRNSLVFLSRFPFVNLFDSHGTVVGGQLNDRQLHQCTSPSAFPPTAHVTHQENSALFIRRCENYKIIIIFYLF